MKMKLRNHIGETVKRGGIIVQEEDYNNKYSLVVQTDSGEDHAFVLTGEQVDRLNTLTTDEIGTCQSDPSLWERVRGWISR